MKKRNQQLVSVIITTKNEEKNIVTCLRSLKAQTYKEIEIIVVDNKSADRTKDYSYKFTKNVFDKGPERSAQRNFGAKVAKGEYVLFLDADMKLSKKVIEECVGKLTNKECVGVIIPEESYGEGFWAECKKLERSFYIGNDFIEAARFFKRNLFLKSKGFDTTLTGPEDWDLSQRMKKLGELERIKSLIYHNEGKLSLRTTLKKKFYYSKKLSAYMKKSKNNKYSHQQLSIVHRYAIFFSHPIKLFKNPVLGLGMLFMKTSEFFVGFLGYIFSIK